MHTATHRSEIVGQLVLVDVDPTRQQVNRAIAGFLAGYSGGTLEAYRLDLRQWVCWLDAAWLAAHVRRPKQNYESFTLGLDRNELGAFLVQAGLSG